MVTDWPSCLPISAMVVMGAGISQNLEPRGTQGLTQGLTGETTNLPVFETLHSLHRGGSFFLRLRFRATGAAFVARCVAIPSPVSSQSIRYPAIDASLCLCCCRERASSRCGFLVWQSSRECRPSC